MAKMIIRRTNTLAKLKQLLDAASTTTDFSGLTADDGGTTEEDFPADDDCMEEDFPVDDD